MFPFPPIDDLVIFIRSGELNNVCKKQKRISVLRKKRVKPKTKKNDDFRKVVNSDKMQEIKKNFLFFEKTKSKAKNKKERRLSEHRYL